MRKTRGLSKSRVLYGLQCEKRLWLQTHRREMIEYDASTQARFDEGNRVGEVARSLFPGGVLMPDDLGEAIQSTQKALELGVPIYEATFRHEGVLVQVDVLEPYGDSWNIHEVKSAAEVKPQYIPDCTVQLWVLEGCGLKVSRTNLMHIDSSFVYPGDDAYDGLFATVDVTGEARALIPGLPDLISRYQDLLGGDCPDVDVGDHCSKPYECPFISHCWPPGPEYPVTLLTGGGKSVQTLLDAGHEDLAEVPEGVIEKELHERQRAATVSGEPYLDPAVAKIIEGHGFPRYYLDFETIGGAIPIWPGTSPYKAVPFQWSVHVETQDGALEHYECLVTHGGDPRREVAETLLAILGDEGPIYVYSGYEKRCLNLLKEHCPDLATQIDAATDRLVDLLPITRANYYHRDMKGSYSIKPVTATVAPDLDYADLDEVSHGTAAEQAFREILLGSPSGTRTGELTEALLRYCCRDTEVMVRLVHHLESSESRKEP